MDKSTQKWLKVINSGRAYSNHQQFDVIKNLEKVAEHHFCKILQKHVSQGDTVLEAGCGYAFDSFYLSFVGIKVVALDISEKLIQELQLTKNSIKSLGTSNLELVVGSIFELDKLNKKFNLVFNHGVYEHWLLKEERNQMLQNFSSVLTNNGKYIVAVPNLKNSLFYTLSNKDVPEMCEFTLSDLANELYQNGFNIIDRGYLFVGPGFKQWLKYAWMAFPINLIDKVYYRLPLTLKKLLAAHIYCVAEKI